MTNLSNKLFNSSFFVQLLIFIPLLNNSLYCQTDSTFYYKNLYKDLKEENNQSIFKAENFKKFNRCITFFSKTKDSIFLTKSLIEIADLESSYGNYAKAFENLWNALAIAKTKEDILLQHKTHEQLAHLYIAFDKKKEALKHEEEVLNFSKKGIKLGLVKKRHIISAYFNFVHFYEKSNQFKIAKAYLDTCFSYAKKFNHSYDDMIFLTSEKGIIKMHEGKTKEAIKILEKSKEDFMRIKPSYLTIIYYNLGNAYKAINQFSKAQDYYSKSLQNIKKFSSHYDYKPDILYNLSIVLDKLKNHKDAFSTLLQYKELSEHLFSPKSSQNEDLLSINNLHEAQIRKKNEAIKKRDRELLEQKTEIIRFRLLSIIAISLFIIGALFWYLTRTRKKFKTEKNKQLIQTKLKDKENKTIIELKNKEITSFTLQLIDKGNLINDIISDIYKFAPKNDRLIKSTKQKTSSKDNLWEQFDKRFTEVNKDFYNVLKSKFPKLTPTDLKHCALIKLNFSAKEMAHLLNISLNGVNTSRYRIRKKLNLQREDNLVSFISSL